MDQALEELDEPLGVHRPFVDLETQLPRRPIADTILAAWRTAEPVTTGVCPTGAHVVPAW